MYSTGAALDNQVFTFDPVSLTLTVHPSERAHAGLYSLNIQRNGVLGPTSATRLDVTVVDFCLSASFSEAGADGQALQELEYDYEIGATEALSIDLA